MLFVMSVGIILTILAISLIGLYYGDFQSQRMQQQAIQAYWNARSGIERYSDARQVPEKGRGEPRKRRRSQYYWGERASSAATR